MVREELPTVFHQIVYGELSSRFQDRAELQPALSIVGPGWGIASCLVGPNEPPVNLGERGFLFSTMELETAVRLKLNLVHMVWIDETCDMVGVEERAKYKRISGADFGPVDVVKYAEAFAAKGLLITSPRSDWPTVAQGVRTASARPHRQSESVHLKSTLNARTIHANPAKLRCAARCSSLGNRPSRRQPRDRGGAL
jgi:Thiamine pyrophosphate enzyme, C-terminal TPP binding domain